MKIHLLFADASWFLLIVILYSRPLYDIFHWKFFARIVCLRKQLGIFCGIFALLHAGIYLFGTGMLSSYFVDSFFWSPGNFLGWGSFALVAMLFPLLTSNVFSQKVFKKNWKNIQRVSYLAFIFTGIHIAVLKSSFLAGVLPVVIWVILWILAWKKSANYQAIDCKRAS